MSLQSKTTKDLKMKKPKVIKVVGNITYLESEYDENKIKRKVSLETRKKLSESRKKAKKQPREGQSKKANNFFKQLEKDYIKFTSARGKFQESKNEEYDYLNENTDIFDNDIDDENIKKSEIEIKEVKKRGKMTTKEKQISENWIRKNENKLSAINSSHGIINEYEIQKLNFSEVKMEESLLTNVEENVDEMKSTLGQNKRKDLEIDLQIDEQLEKIELIEQYNFLLERSNNDVRTVFEYICFKYLNEFLEKNYKKIHHKTKENFQKIMFDFLNVVELEQKEYLILDPISIPVLLDILTLYILSSGKFRNGNKHLDLIIETLEDKYFDFIYLQDLIKVITLI